MEFLGRSLQDLSSICFAVEVVACSYKCTRDRGGFSSRNTTGGAFTLNLRLRSKSGLQNLEDSQQLKMGNDVSADDNSSSRHAHTQKGGALELR